MTAPDDLAAGDFSSWMHGIRAAIGDRRDSDVPCDGCTACCRSSQFIHIAPDETDALDHIPAELLFPAPNRPRGHVVLGYDERGHCPMLIDDKCSIYEHRPQTCRAYDCRVFPAAGLDASGDKVEISRRAQRWRFAYAARQDRTRHDAVRAAAAFLREHPELLRDAGVPANETRLAVLAIELHEAFLGHDEQTGEALVVEAEPESIRAELPRRSR